MSDDNKSKEFSYVPPPSPPQFNETLFDAPLNNPINYSQPNQEASVNFDSITVQPEIKETGVGLHLSSSQEQINLNTSRTRFGQFESSSTLNQDGEIKKQYPSQDPQKRNFEFTDGISEENEFYEFLKRFGSTHITIQTDSQLHTFDESERDNRNLHTHPSSQSTFHDIPVISSTTQLMSQPIHFTSQSEPLTLQEGKSVTKYMENQRSASFDLSQNSTGNTITEHGYFQNSVLVPPSNVENDLKTLPHNQPKSCDMFTREVANSKMPCSSSFIPTHSFAHKNSVLPFVMSHDPVNVAGNDHKSRHPSTSYNDYLSQGNRYECQICRDSFTSFLELQTHSNLHNQETLLRCHKCGLTFNQPSQLKFHNENPLKCDICCNTYSSRRYVNRHMKLHSREPYKYK